MLYIFSQLIAKRESAIVAATKRQKDVQSRKQKALHRVDENSQWQTKVESAVQKFTKECSTPDIEVGMITMI